MTKSAPYAIITPYYKEPQEILERCLASVKRQTVACDHYLISDGYPQDWLDEAGVTHVRLGFGHADFGNTPRGLGALLAVAERYRGIGFLDADNWYEDDHAEICAGDGHVDVVIAKRRFVRYDGSDMKIPEEPDHVDTSCFWLNEGAFKLAHYWLMPRALAPVCDRTFYAMLKAKKAGLAHAAKTTVNYTCHYENMYRGIGEQPPAGAKKNVSMRPALEWLRGLDAETRRLVELQCGVDLVPWALRRRPKSARWAAVRALSLRLGQEIQTLPRRARHSGTTKSARFAVVTPYYREPREMLERCTASVVRQTVKADHFLVADGFPQDWIDDVAARHVRLPEAHGDYGNVARGMGALLAVAAGYEGIGFLDADNWYDDNHVERCVGAGQAPPRPADLVVAGMRLMRPDGTELPARPEPNHVDTNCYWFQPGAYPYLHYWLSMPREMSCIGDRVFRKVLAERQIFARVLGKPTVNYHCLWESVYRSLAEEPPACAKPNVDSNEVYAWYRALSETERRRMIDLCGTNILA